MHAKSKETKTKNKGRYMLSPNGGLCPTCKLKRKSIVNSVRFYPEKQLKKLEVGGGYYLSWVFKRHERIGMILC